MVIFVPLFHILRVLSDGFNSLCSSRQPEPAAKWWCFLDLKSESNVSIKTSPSKLLWSLYMRLLIWCFLCVARVLFCNYVDCADCAENRHTTYNLHMWRNARVRQLWVIGVKWADRRATKKVYMVFAKCQRSLRANSQTQTHRPSYELVWRRWSELAQWTRGFCRLAKLVGGTLRCIVIAPRVAIMPLRRYREMPCAIGNRKKPKYYLFL